MTESHHKPAIEELAEVITELRPVQELAVIPWDMLPCDALTLGEIIQAIPEQIRNQYKRQLLRLRQENGLARLAKAAQEKPERIETVPRLEELDPNDTTVNEYTRALEREYDFVSIADTGELYRYDSQIGIYVNDAKTIIEQTLESIAPDITTHTVNEVREKIRRKNPIDRTQFDADPKLLHVANGWINLDTSEFSSHDHLMYSLAYIPVKYDPKARCPEIMKFLVTTLEPNELKVVIRLLGYLLLRNTKYERAFMLCGEGSNGKSVFIKLLTSFIGRDNTSTVSLQDLTSDRFASVELYNKLLNTFADLRADKISDTGYFKTLVSGDRIRAQRKHGQPFNFSNYAKLVFSANQIPESDDKSYAYYRRWILIPFSRTFTGDARDEHLIERLTTESELSGLLNVAIIGLKRLESEGGFEDSDIEEIRRQYELGASKIHDFITEWCTLEPENDDLFTPTLDFQNAVWNYCKAKGSEYIDVRQLGEKLKALGVRKERKRRKGGVREYCYFGIAIKSGCPYVPNDQPTFWKNRESIIIEGKDVARSTGTPGQTEQSTHSNSEILKN